MLCLYLLRLIFSNGILMVVGVPASILNKTHPLKRLSMNRRGLGCKTLSNGIILGLLSSKVIFEIQFVFQVGL